MSSKDKSQIDHSKLEELEESLKPPEACSIERAPEEKENALFANIKGLKRPAACSIAGHQEKSQHEDVFRADLDIPTFGENVTASEAERKAVLEEIKKHPIVFPKTDAQITVTKNGPYEVRGDVKLSDIAIKTNASGESIGWKDDKKLKNQKVVYLCRCGHSKNMPFCDESHLKEHFDGTCTAKNEPYDKAAALYKGAEGVYLQDEENLCCIVRFCDPDGSCWNLVKSKETVDIACDQAANCCSGRLTVIIDGNVVEPQYEQEIEALVDTERDVLGPLWVKGGIPVKTEDTNYEVRNRVTLCRCGRSYNKPFCDGMHLTCPKLTPSEREEEE